MSRDGKHGPVIVASPDARLSAHARAVHHAEVPCPGGCGGIVLAHLGTDGNGNLVESAEPCPSCRPSRIIVVPPGHRRLVCERCDRSFVRKRQRGRLPRHCPSCRGR